MTLTIAILLCSLLIFTGVATAVVVGEVKDMKENSIPPNTSSYVIEESFNNENPADANELVEQKEQILLCITEEETDMVHALWHISIGTEDTNSLEIIQITDDGILSIPVGFDDAVPLAKISQTLFEELDLKTEEWAVVTTDAVDIFFEKLGGVTVIVPEETEEKGLHFDEGENEILAEKSAKVLTTHFDLEPMQDVKYRMIGEYIRETQSAEALDILILASLCMNDVKYSVEVAKAEELMNTLSQIKVNEIETTSY